MIERPQRHATVIFPGEALIDCTNQTRILGQARYEVPPSRQGPKAVYGQTYT
jgi:hypothetical protein